MPLEENPAQTHRETGIAIDNYLEQLREHVGAGDRSPSALERLKQLYLQLERVWVKKKAGRQESWKDAQPVVDAGMRDGAKILAEHGMLE